MSRGRGGSFLQPPRTPARALPPQVQLHAQRLPLQEHLGAQLRFLGRETRGSPTAPGPRCSLALGPAAFPGGQRFCPACRGLCWGGAALTMAMLESCTAGRPAGTSEMLRKAETETEVPEGLITQRGGADT